MGGTSGPLAGFRASIRVQGLEFRVQGLEFRVQDVEFRVFVP